MPLNFDNRFVRELPGETATVGSSRKVLGACYSPAMPVVPSDPKLLAYATEVAELIGVTESEIQSDWFLDAFSGRKLHDSMQPFAMCYGGHQFGHWAGQLGDGRAINLGEVINRNSQRWMLQLTGAGPTAYSRNADGFAVLRSSVREFLCSEAMHHLGVPTTRALSLVATGDLVVRDMFYDGRPRREPGAIVCRVAPSFVRFGNFEIFAARQDILNLRRLIEYVIRTDFPELLDGKQQIDSQVIVEWFREVCRRTAVMIVHWMRVGFVHGVMNTDNMSILGLTIDYGPYGWLEDYDPTWTPNTTDAEGRRYCYGQQPQIAYWNLAQLANAIYACVDDKEALEGAMEVYVQTMQSQWQATMLAKLGLSRWTQAEDSLIESLFELLRAVETDMTWFYRLLGTWPVKFSDPKDPEQRSKFALKHFQESYYRPEQCDAAYMTRLIAWLDRYDRRVLEDHADATQRQATMELANPLYVLRNYLAQEAIDRAQEHGDPSDIMRLLDVLRNPYTEQKGMERYAQKRPEWARNRPGCSMLSCSS
ncbi:MAG: protein adenylyltransferase SelO [Planctomycetota bacterium]